MERTVLVGHHDSTAEFCFMYFIYLPQVTSDIMNVYVLSILYSVPWSGDMPFLMSCCNG